VKQFCWNWLPAKGSAGGVLIGVDCNVFEVKSWVIKDYIIKCDVFNKRENFECAIVTIYGSAYKENKQEFLDELHSLCFSCDKPCLISGDFNLVRSQKDKSNGKCELEMV
jgi:hypothetical protein